MLSYFHESPGLQGIESFQVELHDLSENTCESLPSFLEQFSRFSKVTYIHFYPGAYALGHILRAWEDFYLRDPNCGKTPAVGLET